MRRWMRGALAPAMAALVAGCQTAPGPLYDWGPYQPALYEQFKGTSQGPEAQIGQLEAHLQYAQSRGRAVPPGYRAHLGYLHLMAGHNDQAARCWRDEQQASPESRVFMDFLLNNLHKQERQP